MDYIPANDTDLVLQSASGSREAFGKIVSRYQVLICSIAYSATGSLSQSEDLAQETFLAAWKRMRDLREPAKLRGWLCGIARNLINNNLRHEGREPVRGADSIEVADNAAAQSPLPAEQAIQDEEQAILWRSLQKIPEAYREPLVLFYRQHQSVERVAAALDLSEELVRQRLSRGRKLLHEQVLAFVESTLERSSPGKAFALGIVAALPAYTATTTAATIGATVKGTALAKSAVIAAIFNALLGVLISIPGTYFAIRASFNATRTPREHKLMREQTAIILVCAAAFTLALIGLAGAGAFRESHPGAFLVVAVAVPVTWTVWLIRKMIVVTRGQVRLRAEERRLHPELFDDAADRATGKDLEYRSRATLLGLPLLHIRYGIADEHAKPVVGWIAIGDRAIGVLFAMGAMSAGGISVGTVSVGIVSVGSVSAGLLSMGGVSLGLLSIGGVALGLLSCGGLAVAWIASLGGIAIANDFAWGAHAVAEHANDALAAAFLTQYHVVPVIWLLLGVLFVLMTLPPAWLAWRTRGRGRNAPRRDARS